MSNKLSLHADVFASAWSCIYQSSGAFFKWIHAHDLAGCDTDTNSPSEACRWQTKFELELNKQKGDVFVSHADRNDGFLRTYSESLLSSITV